MICFLIGEKINGVVMAGLSPTGYVPIMLSHYIYYHKHHLNGLLTNSCTSKLTPSQIMLFSDTGYETSQFPQPRGYVLTAFARKHVPHAA